MRKLFPILIAALAIATVLPGCVNRQLAESYSQYLDTAGAEYIQYVQADPALADDDKAIRRQNHDQAVMAVEKFKTTKWSW